MIINVRSTLLAGTHNNLVNVVSNSIIKETLHPSKYSIRPYEQEYFPSNILGELFPIYYFYNFWWCLTFYGADMFQIVLKVLKVHDKPQTLVYNSSGRFVSDFSLFYIENATNLKLVWYFCVFSASKRPVLVSAQAQKCFSWNRLKKT